MRVAIIGSRKIPDEESVYNIISEVIPRNCSEIVSGGASGIDKLAERYATENNLAIKIFLPEYKKYGKTAPILRNAEIVKYADIIYAFWDMDSNGTKATINNCFKYDKPLKIFKI